MSEVKDASYYLKNPDELTTLSDAQLDALAYPSAATEGESNTSAAAPASTSTAPETPAEPTGDVLSRDGKHTIPFSVLETARAKAQAETQARQEAEARVAELQELATRLEAQVNAAKTGDEAPATSSVTEDSASVSQEELDALRDDFPALAKVLEAQMATVSRLQEQLAIVSKAEQARQADAEKDVQASVQELIDANPKLLHLQTNDPEGWAAAIALDDTFRADPKLAELGTAERFNKVVAAYEAAHGAIAVPQAKTSPSKQSKASTVPVSMSAIPGGTPPAVDEAAAMSAMNGTQAIAHFSKMTPAQIEAALSRL